MNTITHSIVTPMGASTFYARYHASTVQIQRGLQTATSIRTRILALFLIRPTMEISPSEFKTLMEMPNPIHSIRPRFTDLVKDGLLMVTPVRVSSGYGGEEYRYMRTNSADWNQITLEMLSGKKARTAQ